MIFTGQNEKDFEEWFIKTHKEDKIYNNLQFFLGLPFKMQLGVYLAYADSLGIYIEVKQFETPKEWMFQILGEDIMSPFFIIKEYDCDNTFKTRTEAFKQALIELDKIRNKELN